MSVRTLLLSCGRDPVALISWKRALTLFFSGKVEILEEYDKEVRSVSFVMRVPAVVKLLHKIPWLKRDVKFSRANIYARDEFTCQYCGEEKGSEELNLDHVVPRAQDGKTSWTNIVTSCIPCNLKKGNRTPMQAEMPLLREPIHPKSVPAFVFEFKTRSAPEIWRNYCYWMLPLSEEK